MASDALASELAIHIPRWVSSHIGHGADRTGPFAEKRTAGLLLIDIAGFSATTNRFSGRKSEQLNALISNCFAVLTDVLEAHGGDILGFAGDAILAVWDIDDRQQAAARAAQCGLALREVMRDWSRANGNIDHRTIVEVGDVHFCRMGGHAGQWHYFVVGEPFSRIGSAYRLAGVGEVALCKTAAHALSGMYDGETTAYGVRLAGLRSPFAPRQGDAIEIVPRALANLLPRVVRERAEQGHGAWLGEFRTLTIVRIVPVALVFDTDFQLRLQSLVLEVQAIADTLEGTVHQVLMDDKGLSVTLMFGLPHSSHEDDPLRAVETAMTTCRRLRAMGMAVSVGVATGGLFCGDYGGRRRREYGVFGQAVNLATQLADAARGEVVCDAATAQAVGHQVSFTLLPQLYPKGGGVPVLAFSPRSRTDRPGLQSAGSIIGRDSECARLRDCLDDLTRGSGGVALVMGEAGIGKSRVLMEMIATAEAMELKVLLGFATAINRSTAYFIWRGVLRQVLGVAPGSEPAVFRERLQEAFSGNPTFLSWLPLLETVMPVGYVETPLTEQITGAARAAAIEDMVVALLSLPSCPRILVLEDLHWFDSSSLDLLVAVARRVPRLLIVVSNRTAMPVGAVGAAETRLAPAVEIRLQALARDAVNEMIQQRLQIAEVPGALAAYVHRYAAGNPFYCEELVLALRDTGRLTVSRGVCHVDSLEAVADVPLPSSLERAIVSRIDVLSDEDQIVLKVASAIGDEFSVDMLESVFTDRAPELSVAASVGRLVEGDFLVAHGSAGTISYDFRHSISREVTYNLLSSAQRRLLHGAIASFIERSHADQLAPFYARLARHWEQGGDFARSLRYLELAAQQALLNYGNHDAIRYVDELIGLSRRAEITVGDDQKLAWEIISGDAYHELSEYGRSSHHYMQAMQLLGLRLPDTPARKLAALVYNCAVQLKARLLPSRRKPLPQDERKRLQCASHIYEHLSEQYFFQNDSLAVLNGTLASLNLAEECGAAPEIVRGYSALALGLGMSGLVGPARNYSRRAYLLAEQHASLPEMARVHLVGGVLEYGLGQWVTVARCAEQATSLYRRLGDRTRVQNSQAMAAFAALLSGDVATARQIDEALDAELSADSSPQVRAWHLAVRLLLACPRAGPAADDLLHLKQLAEARLIRTDRLLCLGVVAMGYQRRGEVGCATEAALQGLSVLTECSVVWGGYAYGAAGVVDVLLSSWEHTSRSDRANSESRRQAELAVRHLSRLARTSPVCRPFALLARGRRLAIANHGSAARRRWRDAAAAAEKLNMHYEAAEAHCRLGTTFQSDDPRRQRHIEHAAKIYVKLGATADIARAHGLLRH